MERQAVSANNKGNGLEVRAEAQLWAAFREQGDAAAREELIHLHLDFARVMAGKLFAGRWSDEIEFDEYRQLATVALIESVDRYDPGFGASFRTYASYRITGAILSGLESLSERARQLSLRRQLEQGRLHSIKAGDGAEPEDTFSRLASIAVGLALGFVLEDAGMYRSEEGTYADNAYEAIELRQLQRRLLKHVEELPERESMIIRHHYFQQIPFDEIATAIGLTKGRVSQLHRRALMMLRTAWQSGVSAVDMAL